MAGTFCYTVPQDGADQQVMERGSKYSEGSSNGIVNQAMEQSSISLTETALEHHQQQQHPASQGQSSITSSPASSEGQQHVHRQVSEHMKAMVSYIMTDPAKYHELSSKGQERYISTINYSSLYAVILVLFGLTFAVTEAMMGQWMQFHIANIFSGYMHVVSCIFLIYIQISLCISNRRRKREELDTPTTSAKNSDIADDSEDGQYEESKTSQGPLTYDQYGVRSDRHYVKHLGLKDVESESSMARHLDELTTATMKSDGTSVYLRVGFLVFAVGNLILIILEIKTFSEQAAAGCEDTPNVLIKYFHLIFLLIQTFFMLSNTQIEVHTWRGLARFGIMHVLANNFCIWLRTLTEELLLEYKHAAAESDHGDDSNTGNASAVLRRLLAVTLESAEDAVTDAGGEGVEDVCQSSLLTSVQPYLFPFILEYSLIAVAVCASMYHSLKILVPDAVTYSMQKCFATAARGADEEPSGHRSETCFTKSNSGLFTGVLLMTATIIAIIMFFFYKELDEEQRVAVLISIITNILLHALLLVAVVMAACYLRHFRFTTRRDNTIDDALLVTSLGGLIALEVFECISETATLLGSDDDNDHLEQHIGGEGQLLVILNLSMLILEMTQAIVQACFVLDGLQRYPGSRGQQRRKPGRHAIAFLIIGNVTVWVFKSLVVKQLALERTADMFGPIAGPLIINVTLPLLLFYRFHSSVCLADMWSSAYEPLFGIGPN